MVIINKSVMNENIISIIVTLVTVLGSAGAWKFYSDRLTQMKSTRDEEKKDENLYREDLRNRITNLEQLLIESTKEKNKMIDTIITLTSQVATLQTKVEYLVKENDLLIRMK